MHMNGPVLNLAPRDEVNENCHCSIDVWQALRAVFNVDLPASNSNEKSRLQSRLLANLIVLEGGFTRRKFRHDFEHAKDANFLVLQIFKRGSCKGILGDQSWEATPGDVHIFDFSKEFYSISTDAEFVALVIPHLSVGFDPEIHPAYTQFPATSAIGRFLSSTVGLIVNQLPDAGVFEQSIFARGFCQLLQKAMLSETASMSSEQKYCMERRKRMQAYISRNLSDPELGVEHLCDKFNVSRPTIYRDFAELGGVANFITQRRLERAYYQLTSSAISTIRIKDVAFELGFMDPGYFSRLFRQKFGITPREAANSEVGQVQTNASLDQAYC